MAQLSVLKSNVDRELSALASKIDLVSDSIKNVLSDLQNKEHEKSQIEVLKKNVIFLQNKRKSKDTIIESLLETQKIFTKSLFDQKPKSFQLIDTHKQQKLRQHRDHYQHHHQHQQQYLQNQHNNTCNSLKKAKLLLKKRNKVHHFGETILYTKINLTQYTREICQMILLLVICMIYSD